MLWEEYDEKIDEWANSTAVNRLSKIETIGPSEEVVNILSQLIDVSYEFVKKG